jgi:DnaJ-class molecular chaperone
MNTEEIKDDFYEDNLCTSCNGSGEGMWDGSTCSTCKGKGIKINNNGKDYNRRTRQ